MVHPSNRHYLATARDAHVNRLFAGLPRPAAGTPEQKRRRAARLDLEFARDLRRAERERGFA
ncbi:hypothetical protein LHK_02617 [Laribacter hongkongensis HLHK9]|uniref:Uncharacterized protein n=1 Tax=Laribacter hongkongensis (strain HLHK9) TaxID=557598 RepID=C1DCH9_LARHH|nr:hypothetical protein [Laribacter hongkongensis]ACO75598.1 hypothetical protein LHK_02617 [Laribacter hongkongensis HLHK9]